MSIIHYCYWPSPVGRLLLAADHEGLRHIAFPTGHRLPVPDEDWQEDTEALAQVIQQLGDYFGGLSTTFQLSLKPRGTDFQLQVWEALLAIPHGQTRSYGEIARAIGRPSAFRAVGAANGANPLPIVIPCHRVIGSDGSLTGFGGGLDIKRWLLAHENRLPGPGSARDADRQLGLNFS